MNEQTLPTSSALAEASVDSLADLFSRNPETLTDEELMKIVLAEREQRQRHESAQAAAGLEKEQKAAAKAAKAKPTIAAERAPTGSIADLKKLLGGKIGGGGG